ncbi:MAG: hypothetical protein R2705_06855 [Ilumatobacteraceae bacterium]
MLDGDALTVRRTAAISALASRLLARTDARRMLVLGTGQLVPSIVDAHVTSSGIDTVEVWGQNPSAPPNPARRSVRPPRAGLGRLRPRRGGRGADVIVTATAASDPILRGAWLRPGVHVNLLGAFRPDMREADEEVLRRGSVFVDVTAGALQSGDLHGAVAGGAFDPDDIGADLAALGRQPGRTDRASRTDRTGPTHRASRRRGDHGVQVGGVRRGRSAHGPVGPHDLIAARDGTLHNGAERTVRSASRTSGQRSLRSLSLDREGTR